MKTIKASELHQLLEARGKLPVLDVRTPAEFSAEHVPAAHNIPLDELNPEQLAEGGQLSKLEPVYLLCQAGGRATKAAEKLTQAGFASAIVVEGGTKAWIEAGLPVDRGTSKVISLERQVRIGAGSLVVLGVLLAIFVHPYFIALPAFVGTGLVFAGATDWCGMGLLLAKAPWNAKV